MAVHICGQKRCCNEFTRLKKKKKNRNEANYVRSLPFVLAHRSFLKYIKKRSSYTLMKINGNDCMQMSICVINILDAQVSL